jgi:hypothetical protein
MKRSKLLLHERVFQSLTTTPTFYLVGGFFPKIEFMCFVSQSTPVDIFCPPPLAKTGLYGLWDEFNLPMQGNIGGHGQNAGHHCAQKGTTGIGRVLAPRHPVVSAAPSLYANDEKIVADFVPK